MPPKPRCIICSLELPPRKPSSTTSTPLFTYQNGIVKYLGLDFQAFSLHAIKPVAHVLCRTCQVDLKFLGEFDRKLADLNFFIQQLQEQVLTTFGEVAKRGADAAEDLLSFILHLEEQIITNFREVGKLWERLKKTVRKVHYNKRKGTLKGENRTKIVVPSNAVGKEVVTEHELDFVLLTVDGEAASNDCDHHVVTEEDVDDYSEKEFVTFDSGPRVSAEVVSASAPSSKKRSFKNDEEEDDWSSHSLQSRVKRAKSSVKSKPKSVAVRSKKKAEKKFEIGRIIDPTNVMPAEEDEGVEVKFGVEVKIKEEPASGDEAFAGDNGYGEADSFNLAEIKAEEAGTRRLTRPSNRVIRFKNEAGIDEQSGSDSENLGGEENHGGLDDDDNGPSCAEPESEEGSDYEKHLTTKKTDKVKSKSKSKSSGTTRNNVRKGTRKSNGNDVIRSTKKKEGSCSQPRCTKAEEYLGPFEVAEDGSKSYYGIKLEELKTLNCHKRTENGSEIVKTLEYKCLECGYIEVAGNGSSEPSVHALAVASSRIRQHIIEKHSDGYKCPFCSRVLSVTYRQLVMHIAKHKTKQCEICGRILNRNRESLTLAYQRCLWSHKNEEEKQAAIDAGETPPPPLKSSRYLNPVDCTICGKTILTGLTALERHHKKYHEDNPAEKLPCPECGKLLYDFEMNLHQKMVHEKAYRRRTPCSQCDKVFYNVGHLKDHIEKDHSGIGAGGRHQCHICGKPFFKAMSLKQHITKSHEGKQKEHGCHHCGKEFWFSYELKDHIEARHLGNPDYACKVCNAVFDRKREVTKHMEVHLDPSERTNVHSRYNPQPGSCDICGKHFGNKYNISVHKRKHHGEGKPLKEKEKIPGSCGICGKHFNSKESIRGHVRKHHHFARRDR